MVFNSSRSRLGSRAVPVSVLSIIALKMHKVEALCMQTEALTAAFQVPCKLSPKVWKLFKEE